MASFNTEMIDTAAKDSSHAAFMTTFMGRFRSKFDLYHYFDERNVRLHRRPTYRFSIGHLLAKVRQRQLHLSKAAHHGIEDGILQERHCERDRPQVP